MFFSFTFPELGEDERNLENRSLISHGSGLFCSACSENDVTSQRTIALIIRPQLQTVGSLEHKFVMADAKTYILKFNIFT